MKKTYRSKLLADKTLFEVDEAYIKGHPYMHFRPRKKNTVLTAHQIKLEQIKSHIYSHIIEVSRWVSWAKRFRAYLIKQRISLQRGIWNLLNNKRYWFPLKPLRKSGRVLRKGAVIVWRKILHFLDFQTLRKLKSLVMDLFLLRMFDVSVITDPYVLLPIPESDRRTREFLINGKCSICDCYLALSNIEDLDKRIKYIDIAIKDNYKIKSFRDIPHRIFESFNNKYHYLCELT